MIPFPSYSSDGRLPIPEVFPWRFRLNAPLPRDGISARAVFQGLHIMTNGPEPREIDVPAKKAKAEAL